MLPIAHTDGVSSAVFSPDGKKVVTASSDKTANIWDVETGKVLANLKGHTGSVSSATFSPDGKKIVTASKDHTAKIWNAITGDLIKDLKGHEGEVSIATFSPDGKKILTASKDRTANIWDVLTGNILANLGGHTDEIYSATFSPDGTLILTTALYDSTIKIWNSATGDLLSDLKGNTGKIFSASFSPDGKKILTAFENHKVKIWDTHTGQAIVDLQEHTRNGWNESAQFSLDGKKIFTATSYDSSIKIWNAITGNLIANKILNNSRIDKVVLSTDEKKIITTEHFDGSMKIWDAVTGAFIKEFEDSKWLSSVQLSPDGKKIVAASYDNNAKIWDVATGNLLADLRGHTYNIRNAKFSPDGKNMIMLSNKTVKVWDVGTGVLKNVLKGHTDFIYSAEYSPDQKKIVTTSNDRTAKIWDVASGELFADLELNKSKVDKAVFSADGKKILTSLKGGIIRIDYDFKIWDAATGKQTKDLNWISDDEMVNEYFNTSLIKFSPDLKKIYTINLEEDSIIKIWDVDDRKQIALIAIKDELKNELTSEWAISPDGKKIIFTAKEKKSKTENWDTEIAAILALYKEEGGRRVSPTFSPDRKMILTGSSNGGNGKVWNAVTGDLISDLKVKTGNISSAVFSPDNNKILTTSTDHIATIWNIETGQVIYSFFPVDSIDYITIDPYGHFDGTQAARKQLYFVCGDEIINLDQLKDQLWVPDLAKRLNNGDNIDSKKLNELNICGLTPTVEEAINSSDEYFFKITPRRGGLGQTILSVNGTETNTYQPATLSTKDGGKTYELKIKRKELEKYFVSGEKNLVTVKAYTKDNSISSRGGVVGVTETKKVGGSPNLYALMIGVSDYKGEELDLRYAAKDAIDLSNLVESIAKKLLNSDTNNHVFMYNLSTDDSKQLPEKKTIQKALEEIGKKASADDILMIFFAGHGNMEKESKQFYFLTADASMATANNAIADVGISTAELIEWIKPQNIKAQKRILIFDACNSGAAINDFVNIGNADQGYIAARSDDNIQQIKAIDKLNEKSGLFILSASASNQRAYEMGKYSQGLLTYSLLQAIKLQPDILDEGKYLDISRWFNAAEKTVSNETVKVGARQQPQIVSNTNFTLGVVDDEIRKGIVLPNEKPLFVACNFQNADENIMADDLGLNKLTEKQLNDISTGGTDAPISYVQGNFSDAYTLTGRYTVTGNDILIKVLIRKDNVTKYSLQLLGAKDNLEFLAKLVVTSSIEKITKENID